MSRRTEVFFTAIPATPCLIPRMFPLPAILIQNKVWPLHPFVLYQHHFLFPFFPFLPLHGIIFPRKHYSTRTENPYVTLQTTLCSSHDPIPGQQNIDTLPLTLTPFLYRQRLGPTHRCSSPQVQICVRIPIRTLLRLYPRLKMTDRRTPPAPHAPHTKITAPLSPPTRRHPLYRLLQAPILRTLNWRRYRRPNTRLNLYTRLT